MPHTSIVYLSSLLRGCLPLSSAFQAKQIHAQILLRGLLPNVTLQTDLLLVYSKCGFLPDARRVFDRMPERNMHSWNILIYSHVKNSLYYNALSIFQLLLKMGFRPDHFTLPPVFKACLGIKDPYIGRMLHGWVIRLGFEEYVVVGNSVLDFYAKCVNLIDARKLFINMSWRDNIVWNSMISGFGRAGLFVDALNCFKDMLWEGLKMDSRTIPTILNVCGGEGDLVKGKEIHGQVVKSQIFDKDIAVKNSLIDMYAKCGCLHDSETVFRNMEELNLVTWTAMISSYGLHGKGEKSLVLFRKMIDHGLKPNCVTLTAILASCSHAGIIDQARLIFNSISIEYGFEPTVEHYACMVDLLGRFGYLNEALTLVNSMKLTATASIWGALLAGCLMHKNVEIGELAARRLFELEPRNSSNYVAMCSIYESLGIWNGVSKIRIKMRELGLAKTPGCSWITITGRVHKFYQGDLSHPLTQTICKSLNRITKALIFPEEDRMYQ